MSCTDADRIEEIRSQVGRMQPPIDSDVSFLLSALASTDARLAEATERYAELANSALAVLSEYTATPAEGYVAQPALMVGDIDRLGDERDRYKTALEDIRDHSVPPFTSEKWMNYINQGARAALESKP